MNILFVSGYNPFQAGSGPGSGLYYLSQALAEIGCNVHILTPEIASVRPYNKRITLHYYKNPLGKSFFGSSWIPFSFFSIKQIESICEQNNIDIINGESPTTFAFSLIRNVQQPFVVTAHGTSFGELSSLYNTPNKFLSASILTESSIIQPSWASLCKIEYDFADKIIAVSKAVAKEISQYFRVSPKKISVVYNGVSILPLKNSAEENLILTVGRLTWRKGFVYLLHALPSILKDFPNAKLLIVGDGPFKQELINYTHKLNLENNVTFCGCVKKEALFQLYVRASVYVQPSLYEPLGNTVLEAMAYEKPVIATKVGGIPEVITDRYNGLLVEPCNSLMLAEAIKLLLSDSSFTKKIAKNAKKTVSTHFSWDSIAKQRINLYNDCLNEL